MQLLIPYVLNKVAPIHNPGTKVVNFLSMNFCAEQKLEFYKTYFIQHLYSYWLLKCKTY